jgi:hypothetical protein
MLTVEELLDQRKILKLEELEKQK